MPGSERAMVPRPDQSHTCSPALDPGTPVLLLPPTLAAKPTLLPGPWSQLKCSSTDLGLSLPVPRRPPLAF